VFFTRNNNPHHSFLRLVFVFPNVLELLVKCRLIEDSCMLICHMIRNLYIAIDHNYRRIWRYQGEVIRICISKNRQHKIQKGKYKRTNNDLQKHGHFYGLLIKFTTPTEGDYFLSIENGCNIISPKLCVYLIFTAKVNDSSIFITIIACDYLSLRILVMLDNLGWYCDVTNIFIRNDK
jgi:hypothetical protein